MEFFYRFLIYVHVLSAAVSIGPFFALLPIVHRLHQARNGELSAYLNTFQFIVRLTKHAGHVLVISGILLIVLGPWTWGTPWIVMTILIMVASLVFLARAFSPKLRNFSDHHPNKEELAFQLKRSLWIYIIILLAMLWFMIVKPNLW
jgi:hypothetical protein